MHWGIDPASALASLLPRLEPMDNVLIVGAGAQGEAFLLAAHDAEITFLDEDMGVVEQVEARMAGESLSGQFMALRRDRSASGCRRSSASSTSWSSTRAPWPRSPMRIARPSSLGVRNLTRPGGVHVIVPGSGPAAPEAYLSHYPDWDREPQPGDRRGRASRSRGVILARPNQ